MKHKRRIVLITMTLALTLSLVTSGFILMMNKIAPSRINENIATFKPSINTEVKKLLLCHSPNGNEVVYLVKNTSHEVPSFDDIYVENNKTGKIKKFNLENIIYNSELELEWIDDNLVAFTAHINPSLDIYIMINSSTEKLVCKYYGIGFTRDKSNLHIYYILPQPHFSDVLGNEKIYEDDKVIYESDKSTGIYGGLATNDKGDKIVFLEKGIKDDAIKLVVGEKRKNGKIKVIKKIKWNGPYGEMKLNNDNTINIDTGSNNVKFNIESEMIIEKK
jgi:hypothetical protein